MTRNTRILLLASHLSVVMMGGILGLSGNAGLKNGTSTNSAVVKSDAAPGPKNEMQSTHQLMLASSAEYAAAWDSLKDRFLPRQPRLIIQKRLLEEWSLVDLTAAVQAVLMESKEDGPGYGKYGGNKLIECCAPGIEKDPLKAWELVKDKTFELETIRFRRAWIRCVTETEPNLVFTILDELPKLERMSAIKRLLDYYYSGADEAKRDAIWKQIIELPDTPSNGYLLSYIGNDLCFFKESEIFVEKLKKEINSTERKIYVAALSVVLYDFVDNNEEAAKLLAELPITIRGEVAAAGIKYGITDPICQDINREINYANEHRALLLADIALESGNLDALQKAADDPGFARFANQIKQSKALLDWALRLPEDPRTLEIFRQSIEGAGLANFDAIQSKIQALPSGWQREQGLSVLAKVAEKLKSDEE